MMNTKKLGLALTLLLIAAAGFVYISRERPANAQTESRTTSSMENHTDHTPQAADTTTHTPARGLAAYDKNGDGIVYQDGMHPQYVQDEPGIAPDCGMELTPVRVDAVEEGVVRINPATLQNIGVRTSPVTRESIARTVRTTGRFKVNEAGEHTVTLKVSGWVEKLYTDYEGQIVEKGQPLLELYSPELVATQEEYLLALRNARRLGESAGAEDAQRLLEAARRRLAHWDLTPAQIKTLEDRDNPQRTIIFHAPASGEVTDKNVRTGEYIQAGRPLMNLVDISHVWLIVDVYEQDLPWIDVGTHARIELPYQPGVRHQGRVDYLYRTLDEENRSARARIKMHSGADVDLKPGMYATVYLQGEPTATGPVVPEEAVVRGGDHDMVILSAGKGRFKPVMVRTGLQSGGKVQIIEGLTGTETVVTSAQFLIDSEAKLSSAIGAMAHDH